MTDQELKKKLQLAAGIPHLPTDLTYECRIAIAGEGERGWEWQDKPHRLVYDLCRQVEADADRIEQRAATCEDLVKENYQLTMSLEMCHGCWDQALDERNEAEAKLAECEARLGKAVEALTIAKQFLGHTWVEQHVNAVLAELEGK